METYSMYSVCALQVVNYVAYNIINILVRNVCMHSSNTETISRNRFAYRIGDHPHFRDLTTQERDQDLEFRPEKL